MHIHMCTRTHTHKHCTYAYTNIHIYIDVLIHMHTHTHTYTHTHMHTHTHTYRIRKTIDDERKRLREVRTAHIAAIASRTELEGFLRQSIADVKRNISMHRLEALDNLGTGMQAAHVKEERDRVLELLLSQERVVTLLYEK